MARRRAVLGKAFQKVWNEATSPEMVAQLLNLSADTVKGRASKMRKAGWKMKKFPPIGYRYIDPAENRNSEGSCPSPEEIAAMCLEFRRQHIRDKRAVR